MLRSAISAMAWLNSSDTLKGSFEKLNDANELATSTGRHLTY